MFVRVSTLVLAIAASAIAAPSDATPTTTTTTSSDCDTGNIQCCNEPTPASSLPSSVTEILGLLGISVPIDGSIAFGCSPITAIGGGIGADCTQEPICCSNDDATGLVNVVCSPINLNL